MPIDIQKELIKAITFIPGVIGLTTTSPLEPPKKLPEAKWEEGIMIDQSKGKSIITIAVIIENAVSAKVISSEITSSAKNILKKNKVRLDHINILIRGVK